MPPARRGCDPQFMPSPIMRARSVPAASNSWSGRSSDRPTRAGLRPAPPSGAAAARSARSSSGRRSRISPGRRRESASGPNRVRRSVTTGMRDRVAHLAHLPVASFANRELDHRLRSALRRRRPQQHDPRRPRPSILDLHAAPEPLEIALVGHTFDARFVRARQARTADARRARRTRRRSSGAAGPRSRSRGGPPDRRIR